MKRAAILVLCAMTLTATAAPRKGGGGKARPAKGAVSKKREAKKHLDAATKAHEAEQFDVALTELQAAYELDPQPDTMYAIGQVQVKLNNCPEAIMAYEKFLESNPGPEPAALANEKITTCRAELAAQQPPPPPPDPQPPPPPPPESKAFYKDPIGDGLVVVGIGASVAGVIFYMGARSRLEDADTALTYAEQRTIVDDAKGKRNLALIAGSVGVAAIGLGVWRWTTVGKSGEQHRVALVPRADGGGMITWAGTF
jgi:tetratricopeptide (TPR) repeat protein